MSNNQNTVLSLTLTQVKNLDSSLINEEELKKYVDLFCNINPLTSEEKEEVIRELFSRLAVKIDTGSCVKEKNHVSWYYNAKKSIDGKYWQRYSEYLITDQGFAPEVVNSIDRTTDEIMDLLGNPTQKEIFSRKGLVIGEVQSGKTSTYTAIINKAADAGYKVIILLTGIIEKLRQQTQERLDNGFVGLDSTAFVREKTNVYVGVGDKNNKFSACSITSTSSDFNQGIAKQLNIQLSGLSVPVIFVVKKNKSVLKQLEQWLKVYNAPTGSIDAPMLLIDDEADNASVNTRKDDEDPTAINTCIRNLLKLFTRSNYVAFTATPYANIFINPETEDEMLHDDLFPRHFIYALESPTNYIGAKSIFDEDGLYHYMLHSNNDCEQFVPEKHKKEFEPETLPTSLKEAIVSFFITNVIRDLRGQINSHRSMLINISRFINVQNNIANQVDEFVRDYQREYKLYSKIKNSYKTHEKITFTKKIYEKYFVSIDTKIKENIFEWDKIQQHLDEACSSIVVRTVNGGNSKKNLNYDENEYGLRIIAVGGFSLSRGLTLEGLSHSYFFRNSKMYDTLMQMGRWFGYRNHYADLCQIWMSDQSVEWYAYITEAQEDLKREVKKMMNANQTPADFGLGVRNDINSLMVTAVNKMRNTKEISTSISLCGTMIETTYISSKNSVNEKNRRTIYEWLNGLIKSGMQPSRYKVVNGIKSELDQKNHFQFLDVNSENIIDLLSRFEISKYNFNFRSEDIKEMIDNDTDNLLSKWDVIIADNPKNDKIEICDSLYIGPIGRAYTYNEDKQYIQMSGSKSRLGSVNYAKGGLTEKEVAEIEEKARYFRSEMEKNKSFNQNEYFNTGFVRNPLLVIYPVILTKNKNENNKFKFAEENRIYFGLSIGIPDIDGKEKIVYNYKINLIKWKEIIGVDDDFEEETGEE